MRQVNLLPEHLRRAEFIETIRNSLMVIVGVTVVIITVVHSLLGVQVNRLKKKIEQPMITSESPEVDRLKQEVKQKEKQLKKYIKKHKDNIGLLAGHFLCPHIMKIIGEATSDKVWLTAFLFDSSQGTCRIEGRSFSTRLVSEFMLELKKYYYFENINLTSMEKASGLELQETSFKIVLDLNNPLTQLEGEFSDP